MKCIHCSQAVDRDAWFCPNCKRSVPRGGAGGLRSGWLIACGILTVSFAAGAIVTARLRGGNPADAAEVTVREVPLVQVAPGVVRQPVEEEEPAPRRKTERTSHKEKREARQKSRRDRTATAAGSEEQAASGTGEVDVQADSPGKTYVYLNGGTLLGEAPLKNVSLPAGKHTLTFWSPSVGGRSRRTVEVQPGRNVSVKETVRSQGGFKEEEPPVSPSAEAPSGSGGTASPGVDRPGDQ